MREINALTVVLVAAGRAQRMGQGPTRFFCRSAAGNVAHALLPGRTAIGTQYNHRHSGGRTGILRCLVDKWQLDKVKSIVTGGDSRQQSVMAAIPYLDADCRVVAVHDAARPFFNAQDLPELLSALAKADGVIPALPVKDTIKQAHADEVQKTLPRDALWAAQTPQIFWRHKWQTAYAQAAAAGFIATDDASVVEFSGGSVLIKPGRAENKKITEPDDLLWAEFWYAEKTGQGAKKMQSGIGYDVHRLAADRVLVLGGVQIPLCPRFTGA